MYQDYWLTFFSVSTSVYTKFLSYCRDGLISRGLAGLQGKVGLRLGRVSHLASFVLFKQEWMYSVLIEIYFHSFMEVSFLLVANCITMYLSCFEENN